MANLVPRPRSRRPFVEELEPRLVLTLPTPDHIVMVIEENHSYSQIIGSSSAPFINNLAQHGALFTNSYAIEHPSQPNYLDLFSGSNQGVTNDNCPKNFTNKVNLGGELEAAGIPFGGYSEDMPSVGYTGCTYQNYARKHNPWVDFNDVPTADNMPYAGYFPSDYTTLPPMSIVVPNLQDDMHDGSIQKGDAWLRRNLGPYIMWAQNNNSLFILTFDEDNSLSGNHIATIFTGAVVQPGQYSEKITHYNVLRTLEDIFGVPPTNNAANNSPITDVWAGGPTTTSGVGDLTPALFANRPAAALFAAQPQVVDGNQAGQGGVSALPTDGTAVTNQATVSDASSGQLPVAGQNQAAPSDWNALPSPLEGNL